MRAGRRDDRSLKGIVTVMQKGEGSKATADAVLCFTFSVEKGEKGCK